MQKTFTIKGKHWNKKRVFPDLNDYIKAIGKSPLVGNRMKKRYQTIASQWIRLTLKRWKPTKPVEIHYIFAETDKRRDISNVVSFGVKVIEDALQDCGVLENDNPKYLKGYSHEVIYVQNEPYIEVIIKEVG